VALASIGKKGSWSGSPAMSETSARSSEHDLHEGLQPFAGTLHRDELKIERCAN